MTSSFSADGINYVNLLYSATRLDNIWIIYKLLRLLLDNGADPNFCIKDERLYEILEDHAILDVALFDIEGKDRIPYESYFRLWLLMTAYGGKSVRQNSPLKIKEGYDIDMFANCEAFSYRKEVIDDEWYLHIYITRTGEEVAVL